MGWAQFTPLHLSYSAMVLLYCPKRAPLTGTRPLSANRRSSLLKYSSGQVATRAVMGRHLGPGSIDTGIENQTTTRIETKGNAGIPARTVGKRSRWGLGRICSCTEYCNAAFPCPVIQRRGCRSSCRLSHSYVYLSIRAEQQERSSYSKSVSSIPSTLVPRSSETHRKQTYIQARH